MATTIFQDGAASMTRRVVVSPTLPHNDYGPQINFTVWILTGMAAGWLILRVYCKYLRGRHLWWDDFVLMAAWVILVLGGVSISLAIHFGFGKHGYDIEPGNFPALLFVSSFAGSFMIIGAAWSKTSFAMTLLRISTDWQKAFVCFIIVTVNMVLGVSALLTWIRCWPIEKMWHPLVEGRCWPQRYNVYYNIFTAVYSGLMDIVLALLPWNILWGLTMNKKEKLSALAAMSMGVFAGITSFVKIYALLGSNNTDIGDTVQLVVLATAEIAVTIMAASVPILRALARDKVPRAGPFLALDETEHWTRVRTTLHRLDALGPDSPPPVPEPPRFPFQHDDDRDRSSGGGDDGIEMQPPAKRRRDDGKERLQHLSQIEESEEDPVNMRARRMGWTPV